MASLYQRHKSPFWWIKFRDEHGRIRREPTRFRIAAVADTHRARTLLLERTLDEAKRKTILPNSQSAARFDHWVEPYLRARHAGSVISLRGVLCRWKALLAFLHEHRIFLPAQLTRAHCFAYPAWRTSQIRRNGAQKASQHTAVHEIKLLALIMKEAILRDIATANPCRDLGLRLPPTKRKKELPNHIIQTVRGEIQKVHDPERRNFLHLSWEIALYQGCRMRETCVHLDHVDIDRRLITFRIKGGRDHTAILHPKLVPLFERLKRERPAQTAYDWPKNGSAIWHSFLRRIGVGQQGYCFHCTRVTVATRLNRHVDQQIAQGYVGHDTVSQHRRYVRLRPEDMVACLSALDIPEALDVPDPASASEATP